MAAHHVAFLGQETFGGLDNAGAEMCSLLLNIRVRKARMA